MAEATATTDNVPAWQAAAESQVKMWQEYQTQFEADTAAMLGNITQFSTNIRNAGQATAQAVAGKADSSLPAFALGVYNRILADQPFAEAIRALMASGDKPK